MEKGKGALKKGRFRGGREENRGFRGKGGGGKGGLGGFEG